MRPSKIKKNDEIVVGKKYSNWIILSDPILDGKNYKAKCQCSCGTIKMVKTHNLRTGKSKSCGCVQKLNLPKISKGKKAWNSVSPEHKAVTDLINQYKHAAKVRNLTYNLSRNDFEKIIKQKCFYCDKAPSNIRQVKNVKFHYNGIDRFDNNLGYDNDNCRSCCYTCNIMKLNMTHENFIEHINNIIKNNKLQKEFSLKKLNAYHARALAIANQSHDIHTKVSAILIDANTGAVMAEGYNGFIRGAPDDKLPTSRPEKYNYIIHAETNLLCNAVRSGVKTNDAIVYCTLSPCVKCIRMLWQAGVSTFYFKDKYKDFNESEAMLDLNIRTELLDSGFYFMKIEPKT